MSYIGVGSMICVAVVALILSRDWTARRLRREFEETLQGLLNSLESRYDLRDRRRMLGLVDAVESVAAFDYGKYFSGAREITILMNDGQRWLHSNGSWLTKRAADPSAQTTMILVHPTSPYVDMLARKQQMPAEEVVRKITWSAKHYHERFGLGTNVFGHFLYSPYSLVISETRAVYVPYLTSRARGDVPALVFDREEDGGGFYDVLMRDIEALRIDCRPILGRVSLGSTTISPAEMLDFRWDRAASNEG